MPQVMNLNQPDAGFEGEICRIDGDKALKKKLMSLGLRKGQPVSILHQRHKGVVVLSNGSRVALGADIAARIFLQQSTDSASSSPTTEPA
jgi:Fe2+ transport system protein FeoA